ncbi:MAG TPA: hydantoinase B/oxoprolinase family protein, partial [Geminicoccaceae bacterium]|nr:hydantoinase B/oxoprolinase family protein [Geminicoccaceae bacterium]
GPAGYRVTIEVYGGGLGASAVADGCDAVDGPLSNCSNTPVEAQDMEADHFHIVEYALVPDSCGHGRFRGGLGIRRTYEVLKDDVTLSIYADRFRTAPKGLFGGTEGRPARCEVVRGGGEVIPVRSKDSVALRKGDLLVVTTGGGAGYGDPAMRPPRAVAEDVAQGYVSADAAAAVYGDASAAAGSPVTSAKAGRNP